MTLPMRSLYSRRSKCRAMRSFRLLSDGYGRDQPAIVRFIAVRGATIAEEPLFIIIGAEREVFCPSDAAAAQPRQEIVRQIKQPVPRLRRGAEESLIRGVGLQKAAMKFRTNLIDGARNRRADRSH